MVSSWTSVCPSVSHMSVHISFLDDYLSKHQRIFTKLGMCIDIVEIWYGIASGQILSNFDSYLPETYFCFQIITWGNIKGFQPNLVHALILRRSGLRLLMGRFHQFLTVICPWDDNGRVLLFYTFIGWIQQSCFVNTVFALDSSNSVIKRLCCYFLKFFSKKYTLWLTVDVPIFRTIYSILFWPKCCFLYTCCLKYLVEWQTV